MSDIIKLKEEIEVHSRTIKTDKISFSISELKSMYTDENPRLNINPEFQRLFRW